MEHFTIGHESFPYAFEDVPGLISALAGPNKERISNLKIVGVNVLGDVVVGYDLADAPEGQDDGGFVSLGQEQDLNPNNF